MRSLAQKASGSSHGSTPRTSVNTDLSGGGGGVLSQADVERQFALHRELGRGTYGRCVLATCRDTGRRLVLKLMDKRTTRLKDFLHELHTSTQLSAHPHVIEAYGAAFETAQCFAFALEFAPLGDLFEFVQPGRGLSESMVKSVAAQVASALEFLHGQSICHRDLKPENVAVFEPDLSLVKLADFGMARPAGALIRKAGSPIPYTPPEIAQAVTDETYRVHSGTDVWSFGVLVYCCLTGSFPWQVAAETDPSYREFVRWHQRRKLSQQPQPIPAGFREFSPRLQKLLRRLMEPRLSARAGVAELRKYLADNWTVLIGGRPPRESGAAGAADASERQEMESLRRMLERFGVDTQGATGQARDHRVRHWVRTASPSVGLPAD